MAFFTLLHGSGQGHALNSESRQVRRAGLRREGVELAVLHLVAARIACGSDEMSPLSARYEMYSIMGANESSLCRPTEACAGLVQSWTDE